MLRLFSTVTFCAALAATLAPAQTKPSFEVASIKPSAPLDMAKLAVEIRAGRMPKFGAHIDAGRAEYLYLALRDLIVLAYGVKTYQVTGPDWITTQRYDIVAKMPAESKKDDAPKMLQSLLEERFKLTLHNSTAEHPVLGLVVGKGGPKLKESAEAPKPIDESTPLKEGEIATEGPDGPVRMVMGKDGSATVNMGMKGTMSYGMNPATQTFHLDGKMITMSGFADMLTQFSKMGGGSGRQVVDMTELKGHYQIAIDFALADLMQMARSAGMDIPAGAGAPAPAPAGPAEAASDPGGGTASSITTAVQALGLKLESRKAMVEQLIIDHVEKTPTEN
jgi:uncharacterized protein (TIGR03435 family)